jgi:phospholipid/cholesterol/gamma-HCH transport system substrate-binding protein
MNKYRREVTIEILVGLFMFVVLIALGVFTIVLSQENFLKKSYEYEFVFSEIGGLREGDNVFLRGMNIGRVNQTDLQDSHVRVYVTLDVPIRLRHGYSIDVVDASMLGGKYLKIFEGPEDAPEVSENMTILGTRPVDIIGELGRAIGELQVSINSVNAGEGTLGKLLKDEAVYDNLQQITEDVRRMTARAGNGEGSLGMLLAKDDGQLYEDGRAIMANLRTITQNLADGNGTLGQLMSGDDAAFADLEGTLAAVRSIAESISAGEGTLGKLVREERLYDETALLVEDIRAAVDDLREASPITSFGSVLFGAF